MTLTYSFKLLVMAGYFSQVTKVSIITVPWGEAGWLMIAYSCTVQ